MVEALCHHAAPILLLAGFTLLILAPLYPPGRWSTHLHTSDAWSSCYATNWGQHVLWTRPWDYYRMAIFHPQPFPRFFTDVNPFMALVTAPLRLAGSPVLAYNGMMIITMVLVGVAFYATAWLLTRNRRASLVGAVVFSCNGDQLYHAFGHPNIICPLFLPIAVYLAIQIDRERRTAHAIALAACLFLQFPCSFYHGVILMAGVGTAWMALLAGRGMRPGRADVLLAGAFALAMAGAYPLSAPFRELGERLGQSRSLHEAALYSADPVGYLLPSYAGWSSQTILGKWLAGVMPYTQRLENTQFFGYFPWMITCMAVFAAARRWRGGEMEPNDRLLMVLLAVAAVGFVISLGPFLWLGPKLTGIPLPFLAIFEWIPPLRFIRVPARFAVLVGMLVAFGVVFFLAGSGWFNRGSGARRAGFCGVALAVLFLEYFPIKGIPPVAVDPGPGEILQKHSEFRVVAPIPMNNPHFLVAAAETFPVSPSGTYDGVRNSHYREIVRMTSGFPDEESLANLAALDVEALLVFGQERVAMADGVSSLLRIDEWKDGAIYKLNYKDKHGVENARKRIASIPERPIVLDLTEFPEDISGDLRWVPGNWRWLNDETPPQWVRMPWEAMREPGFVYHDLQQVFFDGVSPRPLSEIARLYAKMSVADRGVDHAIARLYWLADGDAGWSPSKSVESYIQPDGIMRVVEFDLAASPAWNPAETVTGLQFEFTTTPHPGERVRVEEIRLAPLKR